MRTSKPPDAILTAAFKPPKEKKPGEDYHWDNGGLWSWKEERWIIPPKGAEEKVVTPDDILKTYNVLKQMGVVEDYQILSWFSHWIIPWQPSKEERTKEINELIKNIVGDRDVSPELNALFPDLGFKVGKTGRDVRPRIQPKGSFLMEPKTGAPPSRKTGLIMNSEKQSFIQYPF